MEYDVIILGAGTAGLSAAIYAVRAGLSVLIIEKSIQGGQIIYSPEVDNYPGILKISGADFVGILFDQATRIGAKVVYENVSNVSLKENRKRITTAKNEYTAKTVIIANGALHRHLEVEGEDRLNGRGVSYCATCDGAFFKDKDACVVGGGDTALEDAVYLSNLCCKVYLIHRRDEFRGKHANVQAALKRENIVPVYDTVVEEIQGEKTVEGVLVKNVKTGETRTIKTSAVFVAVGLQPDNALFKEEINIDTHGYVVAGEDCKTNLPGVFVAGDTRTKELRQLITAAADGAVAATGCSNFINSLEE